MTTTIEYDSKTIVIIGNQFNPSFCRDSWFVSLGILSIEELLPEETILSAKVSQIATKEFVLIITQGHIQFQIKETDDAQALIHKVLLKVLGELQQVQYVALGLNFDVVLTSDIDDNKGLSKNLFYSETSPAFSALEGEDAFYGGYISQSVINGRLKLNMRPSYKPDTVNTVNNPKCDFMHFNFNYHHDISAEDQFGFLNDTLSKWIGYFNHSGETLKAIQTKL